MALEKSKRFRHFVKEVCCCCCCCFVSFIHSFHLKCELYGRTYDTSQIHCACEKVHTREGKHTRNFESFNFLFVVIVRAVIRHRVVVHVFLQVHQYQLQLYIRLLLRRISCILSVAASSSNNNKGIIIDSPKCDGEKAPRIWIKGSSSSSLQHQS